MKSIIWKVAAWLMLGGIVCTMLFLTLLSPYEEWDASVVNYDVLDVLKIAWLGEMLINTTMGLVTMKSKKVLSFVFFVLAVISTLCMVSVFLIQFEINDKPLVEWADECIGWLVDTTLSIKNFAFKKQVDAINKHKPYFDMRRKMIPIPDEFHGAINCSAVLVIIQYGNF